MKRLVTLGAACAGAVTIAACGSSSGGGSAGTAAAPASQPCSHATVAVRQLSGVGRVLVNDSGDALYTPNLEASGKILCATGCTSFWKPLTVSGAKPTTPAGVGTLGVINRPDGGRQVTINGKPLYTFSQDSPGKATGNGFADQFGGHHFMWHLVTARGTTVSSGSAKSTGSAPASGGGGGGYSAGY